MKKLLIISIGVTMLMMTSCGEDSYKMSEMQWHKELYQSTTALTNLEFEELLEFGPPKFADYDTFVTRLRTKYGYSCPLMYRWDETKQKYVFCFALKYNPVEFKDMGIDDQERFFPDSLGIKELTYTGK